MPEGLNQSALARVKGIGWNTVAHWLEKAAASCRRFNDCKIAGFTVAELQADEIRTVGGKDQPIWIFASIEVWSRLWPSAVVGRGSYRNTFALFRDISSRMNLKRVLLFSTDVGSERKEWRRNKIRWQKDRGARGAHGFCHRVISKFDNIIVIYHIM
jgi:hypothetical protein